MNPIANVHLCTMEPGGPGAADFNSAMNRHLKARGCETLDAIEQSLDVCAFDAAQELGYSIEFLPADWVLRHPSVPPHFYPRGVSR